MVAGFLLVSATRILLRERALRVEEQALAESVRKTEGEVARLQAGIDAGTSHESVERLAKERLNLKNPGEEVVVVSPKEETESSAEPRSSRFSLSAFFGFSGWLGELFSFLER